MQFRSFAKRGRSAIAWFLAAFAALQLGLLAVLEMGPAELRDPEYGVKLAQLRERLAESAPGRPLMLLLGSSRVGVGIRPAVVMDDQTNSPKAPLVFNFALCGSGPVMELLCLRRLLDEGILPDRVLVEVWSPLMLRSRALTHAGWQAEVLRPNVARRQ